MNHQTQERNGLVVKVIGTLNYYWVPIERNGSLRVRKNRLIPQGNYLMSTQELESMIKKRLTRKGYQQEKIEITRYPKKSYSNNLRLVPE